MQKVTLLLVIAALGVAGWQAWEGTNLRQDLEAQQAEQLALRGEVARLTKDLHEIGGFEESASPLFEAPTAPASPDGGGADAPTLAARAASPAVLAREIQGLKKDMAAIRAENEALKETMNGKGGLGRVYKQPTFINNLDAARKALDLSSGQAADLDRTIEWTKRELEDLYAIPNADGKLFNDIKKTTVSGGEGFQLVMPNFGEINKFRSGKIPGRSETYAEADQRIRERGKREIRDTLTPEQQKTWDEAHTDSLFGENNNGAFSMISVGTRATASDGTDEGD